MSETRELKLTRGYVALVDAEDYERLEGFKWYPRVKKDRKTVYAMRNSVPRSNAPVYLHYDILPPKEGFLVDHKSTDGLDNRKENLRYVTNQQSVCNRTKFKSGLSKFKGVSLPKGCVRWRARIRKNGKMVLLGGFDSELEAAKAYDFAAKELHGEFARLNFL